jgi:hypothetical protein
VGELGLVRCASSSNRSEWRRWSLRGRSPSSLQLARRHAFLVGGFGLCCRQLGREREDDHPDGGIARAAHLSSRLAFDSLALCVEATNLLQHFLSALGVHLDDTHSCSRFSVEGQTHFTLMIIDVKPESFAGSPAGSLAHALGDFSSGFKGQRCSEEAPAPSRPRAEGEVPRVLSLNTPEPTR